jgi:Ca-activated chloride channel family protein
MTFASPELLIALALVPLAVIGYLLIQRRRSRYAVRFTNVDLLANIAPKRPAWRRHLPPILYLAALAALAVALARPAMVVAVPKEQATVVLAIDVSRSMEATDVSPTRLGAAVAAATTFVDQMPEKFKVGLVAFSTSARLVVSPTEDHSKVKDAIANLRPEAGTALGDAIALSVEAGMGAGGSPMASPTPAASPEASPDPNASPDPDAQADTTPTVAAVVLSDGANSTGDLTPEQAAQKAADAGVPVYTIALGTESGTVQVPNDFGFLETVNVPPDPETLATVAEMTGGRAFQAPTAEDLAQIYQSLGSKVGVETEQQDVTYMFAGLGLIFVVAGGGLAALWFNRFP